MNNEELTMKLAVVEEKLDAVIDLLLLVTGTTNPDAPFSLRQFSDGTGRFLPVDRPPQKEG